jgi:two-component sensor histidine kinase
MVRLVFKLILCSLLLYSNGQSQISTQPPVKGYTYYHPSKDKASWQRLNLLLSSTFIVVAREGLVQHDTCLYIASRSLSISRFSVLAEGIDGHGMSEHAQWVDRQEPATGIRLLSAATGRKRLQLLLLLGAYYAFEPNSYYRYRDSVEYFLNKAVHESKTLKEEKLGRIALCLLGKMYVQANDSKGDSTFNRLIDQCRKANDKETEARAFAYRGIYMAPTQVTFLQKVTDLQAATELYHRQGNTEGEINVLTDLGYMLIVTGQFQAANEIFVKALSLADSIRFPYTHYNTEAVAVVTYFQGRFGEPLRYTFQSIKVAESCRDSIGLGYFYARLSDLYSLEGRAVESEAMAQKAIKRFVSDRNPSVYAILSSIVDAMCEGGRATEALQLIGDISKKVNTGNTLSDIFNHHYVLVLCYLDLNRLDSAEFYIKKMDSLETMAEAIRGPLRRSIVTNMYGHLSFRLGQYQNAKKYFEKYFTTPSYGQRTLINDLDTYHWLIVTDSILGDNLSVISHYKKYIQLLDSNFRVTKIRQAEELQVIYETQEKDNQISTLNRQTQLEKDNAKQATLVKNLAFAGIIAVITIAGLLYRQNRLKQRSNKVITGQNEQLQYLLTDKERLLADKEWLLKEIHHRVKNNLQIIMSLLDSQSIYIDDRAALTAINDSQRRVQAISLIHQKLYQSENTSSIDMPRYIDELVGYLKDSFDTGSHIVVEQDIEPVKLDVAKAIPLGLIINEGIVNAIKYAYPSGRTGIVRIGLKYDGSDHLLLHISDNGIGLPPDVEISKQDSLGFSLMQGLTRQLDGTINIESNKGLHISIRFSTLNDHAYE